MKTTSLLNELTLDQINTVAGGMTMGWLDTKDQCGVGSYLDAGIHGAIGGAVAGGIRGMFGGPGAALSGAGIGALAGGAAGMASHAYGCINF